MTNKRVFLYCFLIIYTFSLLHKGWDNTVNIGTLSIQKSTDTYQYGHYVALIHLEV